MMFMRKIKLYFVEDKDIYTVFAYCSKKEKKRGRKIDTEKKHVKKRM